MSADCKIFSLDVKNQLREAGTLNPEAAPQIRPLFEVHFHRGLLMISTKWNFS
jgi:hypothetical protein